jgi:hypothetical protein
MRPRTPRGRSSFPQNAGAPPPSPSSYGSQARGVYAKVPDVEYQEPGDLVELLAQHERPLLLKAALPATPISGAGTRPAQYHSHRVRSGVTVSTSPARFQRCRPPVQAHSSPGRAPTLSTNPRISRLSDETNRRPDMISQAAAAFWKPLGAGHVTPRNCSSAKLQL